MPWRGGGRAGGWRRFDTIPHSVLLARVREKVTESKVLGLWEAFLTAKVMETAEGWTPEEGTPQGAVSSPLLSNLYLDPLDQLRAAAGFEMVRYADDFVILCRGEAEARPALEQGRGWTAWAGLSLHPVKTRIVDARQAGGFDFRGYHFEQGRRWPRRKSLDQRKDTVRAKTRRTSGQSLAAVIRDLNRSLRGWFGYFPHSSRFTFRPLDQGVRERLRSLLRSRPGRPGRARGADYQRGPNAFLVEQGLFSLVTAHALACQSSWRSHHGLESRMRETRPSGSEEGGG